METQNNTQKLNLNQQPHLRIVCVCISLCTTVVHYTRQYTVVESCSIDVAFGQSSFTDLDFADDVSLLAELLELLVPHWRQWQVRQHPSGSR